MSTGVRFFRPIGPQADTQELEYVAALQQTCPGPLRGNGTVKVNDISSFLMSRHGVKVDEDTVQARIIEELCGSIDTDVIDLCQIVSLLIIPFLRWQQIDIRSDQLNIIDKVLHLIEEEAMSFKVYREHKGGIAMTTKLLREIFESYGDFDIPEEVLEDMTIAAGGDNMGVVLTPHRFERALTADISIYDPLNELELTTHYEDGSKAAQKPKKLQQVYFEDDYELEQKPQTSQQFEEAKKLEHFGKLLVKQNYTAAQIDYAAETFRSPLWVTLLWICVMTVFLCYIWFTSFTLDIPCGDAVEGTDNSYGCRVLHAVVAWFAMLLKMVLLGVTFVFLGSSGNSTAILVTFADRMKSTFMVLVAVVIVFFATIYTFIDEKIHTPFIQTEKNETFDAGYYISLLAGSIIIFLQLTRLISIWYPQLSETYFGFAGGTQITEKRIKQAATTKINAMLENAIIMHPVAIEERLDSSLLSSTSRKLWDKVLHLNKKRMKDDNGYENSSQVAFSNFQSVQHMTEPIGGMKWAWSRILNQTIFTEEGVWLHSRLVASNVTQFVVSIFLVVAVSLYFPMIRLLFYPPFVDDSLDQMASEYAQNAINASSFLNDLDLSSAVELTDLVNNVTERVVYVPYEEVGTFFELLNISVPKFLSDDAVMMYPFLSDINTTSFFINVKGDLFISPATSGAIYWAIDSFDDNISLSYEPTDGAFFYNTTNSSWWFDKDYFYESKGLFGDYIQWWEIETPFLCGLTTALLSSFGIAFTYIPSFVSIVLKFRSGFFQSLRDPAFLTYRTSQDSAAVLFGSAFWGVWFTSITSLFAVAIIVFVLISPLTRSYVVGISAQLLGAACTILINTVILQLLRKEVYTPAFYRRRPAAANFIVLALECWNIALTVAFMLIRTIKLLLVVIFYVGRVDTPVLAPGVGDILCLQLDSIPTAFKKDVLIHEAHHHPYIERLGLMYLLKLRHGVKFGSRAGAYWRLLFVLALMPWMRTYRADITDGDGDDEYFSDDEITNQGANGMKHKREIHVELHMLRKENRKLRKEIKKLQRRDVIF